MQFLCRELSTIFTVEYFLEVILSIYRFKKDCFPLKMAYNALEVKNW